MLESSLRRILAEVDDDAVVLDIGGWGKPLTRADFVIDLMPYESRGLYGRDGDGAERFTRETWIQRDICDREPFPFRDGEIDFVVCSHTLEDVRDPVWVCAEITRVGKAGYVEVPSRLEELSYGVQGPWVGWGHHHWLVDVGDQGLEFVFKHHVVHGRSGDLPARLPRHPPPRGTGGAAVVDGRLRASRAGCSSRRRSSIGIWATSSRRTSRRGSDPVQCRRRCGEPSVRRAPAWGAE